MLSGVESLNNIEASYSITDFEKDFRTLYKTKNDKFILVFDEPTSGLDYCHMEQTARLIDSLKGQKTIFIVTHDPEFIIRCCTHILHLEEGTVYDLYELNQEGTEKLENHFFPQ